MTPNMHREWRLNESTTAEEISERLGKRDEGAFEPGDPITLRVAMQGRDLVGFREIDGYYGGRRSNGATVLFLYDVDGVLRKTVFGPVPDFVRRQEHPDENSLSF